MTRVKFATLLVALIIGCTSVGGAASYYLNSMLFTINEPFVYPCPNPDTPGLCTDYMNQPKPDAACGSIAGHPSTPPIFTSSPRGAASSISSTMTPAPGNTERRKLMTRTAASCWRQYCSASPSVAYWAGNTSPTSSSSASNQYFIPVPILTRQASFTLAPSSHTSQPPRSQPGGTGGPRKTTSAKSPSPAETACATFSFSTTCRLCNPLTLDHLSTHHNIL